MQVSFLRFKEAFFSTITVLIIVKAVSLISLKGEFTRPIKQELDDFNIYDLEFAGKDKEDTGEKYSDIIIVQAANSRPGIVSQLRMISNLRPRVTGVDLSFQNHKERIADSMLKALLKDKGIVTGYTLNQDENDGFYIKEQFLSQELLKDNGGFINFSQKDSLSVIRAFKPYLNSNGKKYTSFAAKVVERFNKEKVALLAGRDKEREDIFYYGNINHYLHYTADEFNTYYEAKQLNFFQNKIILLGFFETEDSKKTFEDIKFSPLNEKMNGRSFPDIYGVVIHANIIEMILNGDDYTHEPNRWLYVILIFIVCFIMQLYIVGRYSRNPHPSHIAFFFVQLFYILSLTMIFLIFYSWFHIKINPLPFILSIVLSVEMFDAYPWLVKQINRLFEYKSIFYHHN